MIQSAKGEDKLDPDKLYSIYDTNWLWLEKCGEGEYHVFYQSTEPEFDAGEYEDTDNPVCSADETAAYLGTITQEHPFVAPLRGWRRKVPRHGAGCEHGILYHDEGCSDLSWMLPDAEVINTGNDAYSRRIICSRVRLRCRRISIKKTWNTGKLRRSQTGIAAERQKM